MSDIIFEMIKILVMVVTLIVSAYLVPWIKGKIGADNLDVAVKWAKNAVLMAEQVLWNEDGVEKKAYVTKFLKELLMAKNIALSDEELNVLIEAAVKQMKISQKTEEGVL